MNNEEIRSITIYDNGGKSWDRYTILIDRDYYGMSANALMPDGFNMYIGDYTEVDPGACGKLVKFNSLPDQVKQAIERRFNSYAE